MENNVLCLNYRIFKPERNLEQYLTILEYSNRAIFSKFRCGSHYLPISIQRFNMPDERNICPICNLDVGDEFHYVMACPAFNHLREQFINQYFYRRPNAIKFRELTSTLNKSKLISLCKFLKIIIYTFRP